MHISQTLGRIISMGDNLTGEIFNIDKFQIH
jgi:hypothetical protein